MRSRGKWNAFDSLEKAVGSDKQAVRDTAAWVDTVVLAVPFGALDEVVRTAGDALAGRAARTRP